jgi:hypothetical protein
MSEMSTLYDEFQTSAAEKLESARCTEKFGEWLRDMGTNVIIQAQQLEEVLEQLIAEGETMYSDFGSLRKLKSEVMQQCVRTDDD